ncbi:MAG: molybdenum cofactor guanylyltransferase [Bacteroidota bacterium]
MSQTKQITGIILCGGKSSRMGQNKALLEINGKYIISYAIEMLQPFCDEIIISTNTKELDFLGHKTVKDIYDNIGPISGIFSALLKSKNNKNVILSCDTPFINSLLITEMFSYLHDHDIVIPEFKGYLQPMTGVFKKDALPVISHEIQNGNYIPPRIFEKCNLKKFRIDERSMFYHEHLFFNVNSPEDYSKAQEIMKNIKE